MKMYIFSNVCKLIPMIVVCQNVVKKQNRKKESYDWIFDLELNWDPAGGEQNSVAGEEHPADFDSETWVRSTLLAMFYLQKWPSLVPANL